MKKVFENKYFSIGLAAFCVIGASLLLYFFMLRFDIFLNIIKNLFIIIRPLFYGIIIAFLSTQTYNYFNKTISKLLKNKLKNKDNINKISKTISIIISILLVLLVLFLFIYILIPQLIISILSIIETWTYNVENLESWLIKVLNLSPALENTILNLFNKSSTSILEWLSASVIPTMESISSSVTTGLNDMYIFVKDFIIGMVFSVYILSNKSKFIAQLKKISYNFLGIKKGNSFLRDCRYVYKVFNGFIKGKLLTSLIIGTACYICMLIFKMPYALLISFIVAITNIIPFFGPIIGWIPGVILIALVSPIKALYFTIIIIILQQIEGNILEPKIVGNNIGIPSFWVLFAIILFGGIFGFVGMIFGVPIFAIIYHFITARLNNNLNNKNLPTNIDDYIDLKYIDETTERPIKLKKDN